MADIAYLKSDLFLDMEITLFEGLRGSWSNPMWCG